MPPTRLSATPSQVELTRLADLALFRENPAISVHLRPARPGEDLADLPVAPRDCSGNGPNWDTVAVVLPGRLGLLEGLPWLATRPSDEVLRWRVRCDWAGPQWAVDSAVYETLRSLLGRHCRDRWPREEDELLMFLKDANAF